MRVEKIHSSFSGIVPVTFGTIYNAPSFSSLSDFTVRGSVTPTISSGKIAFTGGAGVYTNGINLTSPYNMLESFTMTVVAQWISGSNGFGIGIFSKNTGAPYSVLCFFSAGQYGIACGNPFVNHDLKTLTTSSGDNVRMVFTKAGPVYTLTVTNITTGASSVVSTFTVSPSSTAPPLMDNTSQFSIWTLGDTFNVISLDIATQENKYSPFAVMGDSVSQGYEASIYANGYVQKLKVQIPTLLLLAGQSDKTDEAVLRLPQLLSFAPRKLLMEIGINDITGGVPTLTWQTNYASIVSQCESAGISVYHLKPYSTSTDLSAIQSFQTSNYSGKIIDPMTSGAGNFAANGIHYNDTGNTAVYNAILNSGFI